MGRVQHPTAESDEGEENVEDNRRIEKFIIVQLSQILDHANTSLIKLGLLNLHKHIKDTSIFNCLKVSAADCYYEDMCSADRNFVDIHKCIV